MNSSNHTFSTMCTWNEIHIIKLLIGIFIVIENLLNIIIICTYPQLRTKTNVILASLASADLATGILLVMIPSSYCYLSYVIICEVTYIVSFMLLSTSAFHLMVVTLDRYLAILYPLHYTTYFPMRRVIASLLVCWSLPLISGCSLIIINGERKFRHLFVYQFPHSFQYTGLIYFVFVCIVLVAMYIQIFIEIHRQHNQIQTHLTSSGNVNKSQVRTAVTLLVTVGCFLFCWLPFFTCMVVGMQ